jgi:AAA domain/RepB DNA-primase from phage plasmid/IclR helix-turn-helix domain
MKESIATVHAPTVREFIHIITAQAKAALANTDKPGVLQLTRLHPSSETLVPSRFTLDDTERMIETAISDSENGHNVYIEGRSVRTDLRGNARGALADTVGVFALVIDSDADKGMGWTPTVPVSMTVETSPGNFQFWFFLREAISAEHAQRLGERIRAAVNSDHDSGNPTQPYRVAGTVNYPSAKKIARGRVTVPTKLIEFDAEVLAQDFEEAFPLPEREPSGDGNAGGTADEADIPADTMRVIRGGIAQGSDRSHAFFNVVLVLKHNGWTVDGIVALLDQHSNGIAAKYQGRLRHEVERIYGKIDSGAQAEPKAAQPTTITTMETLKTMTFPPIKYVVPGILVEGLTLIAGKPKIGKSWLLLHAALAVARGGFTLGDLHCVEGDVLYCALEDSERRMQSRATKLLGIVNDWPKRMGVCHSLPRLGDGGANIIRNWIETQPHPRLIVIDPLAMIRALKKIDESNYQSDYLALLELRDLANKFGVAVAVVHHLRKAEADDPFDTISGTLGLTGAVDSILALKRDSGGKYVLHGKGRDLIELEKALSFDRGACLWRIEGEAADLRRSAERTAILDAIAEAKEPLTPTDIAAATRMKVPNVKFLLRKLLDEGVIEKAAYGSYQKAGTTQSKEPPKGRPSKRAAPRSSDGSPPSEPLMSWEVDDLRARGFSADDVFAMAPQYARAILADPKRNKLSERYGAGGDAPADTLCRVCKKPGARFFAEPITAGERKDRFPGMTPLHLECCPKWFEGGLPMED